MMNELTNLQKRNMRLKKRMLPILLAAAITAGMTGCSKEKTGSTMEIPLELSYASTQLLTDYYRAEPIYASDQWIVAATQSDGDKYNTVIVYNTETGEVKKPELQYGESLAEGRYVFFRCAAAQEDGGLALLCSDYKMRGFECTDVRHYMDYYDAELQFTERVEMPEGFAENTVIIGSSGFVIDGEGYAYLEETDENGNTYYEVYDENYVKQGEILMPGTRATSLSLDAEGRVNVLMWSYDEETYENSSTLFFLDGASLSYERRDLVMDMSDLSSLTAGNGDYSFYYNESSGIYGVKTDGTSEKVLDWVNSDFGTDSVERIYALPDGRFLAYTYSGMDELSPNSETWLLRARTEEEITNTQFISLAAVNLNSNLQSAVIHYNRNSTENRIVIRDYGEYNTDYEDTTGYEMFKADMMDGIVADMICTDGLPFFSLANKGMFEDLNTFLEEDETFHEEDYLMSFFDAMEYGGRLERIGFSYTVLTSAAKTAHVGTKQGMTLEEYLALAESLPEGRSLMQPMDEELAKYNFFSAMQNCYINTDTMTCSFDSPEFVRLLELVKHITEEGETIWGSSETLTAYSDAHPFPFRDDSATISFFGIWEPIKMHESLMMNFGPDEETTLTGYPLADENGNGGMFSPTFTISMNAQSTCQEEIWDFMQYLLGEEYQQKMGMPVLRSALDLKLSAAEHMPMATGGSATEEETALLAAYLEGITECWFHDETVYNILSEEAGMYLAGDCTAEEAAEMIQNRVSIYLSEQS